MKNWEVYGIVIIVVGSIFMVSGQFMDTFNSPKYDWAELTVLALICLKSIGRTEWRKIEFRSGPALWGILFIVFSMILRISSCVLMLFLILYTLLLLNLSKEQKLKAAGLLFWGGCLQAVYYLAGHLQILPVRMIGDGADSFDNVAGFVCTGEKIFYCFSFFVTISH